MSGILYDLSKIKAFAFDVDGVLSTSTIPLHPSGEPMRMINIKDGYAIQYAVKSGYPLAIISGGKTDSVIKLFTNLGFSDIFLGADIKLPIYEKWLEKHNLTDEEVMFMGDDIPDMEIMLRAGLPVAPADAANDVLTIAKYISPYKGGEGCGREIIETVMKAQGKWIADKKAFGW